MYKRVFVGLILMGCSESEKITSTSNTENVIYLKINDSQVSNSTNLTIYDGQFLPNSISLDDEVGHVTNFSLTSTSEFEALIDASRYWVVELKDSTKSQNLLSWTILDSALLVDESPDTLNVLKPAINISGEVEVPHYEGITSAYLVLQGTNVIMDVTDQVQVSSVENLESDTLSFNFQNVPDIPSSDYWVYIVWVNISNERIIWSNFGKLEKWELASSIQFYPLSIKKY